MGADISYKYEGRYPILFVAAEHGNQEIIEYLIAECKENVNAMHGDHTVMMVAAENNHYDLCRFLKHSQADPEKANAKGENAVSRAINAGHDRICQYFLEANCDVNHKQVNA